MDDRFILGGQFMLERDLYLVKDIVKDIVNKDAWKTYYSQARQNPIIRVQHAPYEYVQVGGTPIDLKLMLSEDNMNINVFEHLRNNTEVFIGSYALSDVVISQKKTSKKTTTTATAKKSKSSTAKKKTTTKKNTKAK